MNSSIFEQRSRFAMIGALMVIISLMFLFVCVDTSDLYLMYRHRRIKTSNRKVG